MAKAKAAGSFLGGLSNNPGIIIIAVVAIALFLFRDRISNAFASVGQGLGEINIQLPEINLPDISFPELPTFEFPSLPSLPPIFGGGEPEPTPPEAGPVPPDESGGFVGLEIPEGCTVNPDGTIACPTPPTFDVCATFPDLCGGVIAPPEQPTQPEQPPIDTSSPFPIDVQDPEAGGEFGGGGTGFEGGFIFENPIDTLSEVLAAFPQLTASQAADFLAEFSGILPSQLPFIDPDVTNITAPTGETAGNVGISDLEEQEQIAACTSCQLFGLNCPLCSGV